MIPWRNFGGWQSLNGALTAVADLLRIWAPLAEVIDGSWPDLEAGPVIRMPQEAPGKSQPGLKSHLIEFD